MDRVNGLHLKRCYLPLLSDCESDVDTPASPESESSNPEVGASGDSHDSGSSQLEEDKESDLEVAASGDSHSGSSQWQILNDFPGLALNSLPPPPPPHPHHHQGGVLAHV